MAATVATSAAVYGGLLPAQHILFFAPWIYKKFPPEIWRLVTSFLLTGPQLGMVFDPFLLWTYGSNLEKDSPRFTRKGDFFVYVAFLELTIVVRILFFHHPLRIHLLYTSQSARPASVAVAVPEVEGDHPCIVHKSIIRNHKTGLVWNVGMVGIVI